MSIRLDMTMSLDGYVVGPNDNVDAPMGDGGFRLFNWLDRREVPVDPPPGSVRYVTDPRAAAAEARAAAGDADVVVQGAGAGQALLRAGELDELELHVVPVLLGQGRRLFDNVPRLDLDLVRRLTTGDEVEPGQRAMHLRYRIRRAP